MPKTKTTKKAKSSPKQDRVSLAKSIAVAAAFDGWNDTAITQGAKSLGLNEADAKIIFPLGIRQVITCFSDWALDETVARIRSTPHFAKWRTRDKIAHGVMTRFEVLRPYRESMGRLVQWAIRPQNAPTMIRQISKIVDVLWVEAGDQSTDYNFYTKRGLLAAVFKTTTIYWLQDRSKDSAPTRAFLEKQIGVILKVGQKIGMLRALNLDALFGGLAKRFKEKAA